MSTISEALKKVQRQRMARKPEPELRQNVMPPPLTPAAPHRPASAAPVSRPIRAGVVSALVAAAVSVAVFYLMRDMPFATAPPAFLTAVPARVGPADSPSAPAPGPAVAPTNETIVPPPAPSETETATADTGARMTGTIAQPKPARPPADAPVLSATFASEKNPVAIINGITLKEGETVGAYRVGKIADGSVILKSDDGEFEIRMR